MKQKGHDGAIDFVKYTLPNFNQIYDQKMVKYPNRFVLYCKGDKSKGFMPIDLEFEQNNNSFYTIVSAMPHNTRIKGTLIYDESATSSTATVNSELLPDRSNKDGATSRSAANIKVPINQNIPQAPESMQGYGVTVQGEYPAGERQYSGAELLRLAKENNVPVNRKLGTDLRAGVPKALEVMQKRLAERGVDRATDVEFNIQRGTAAMEKVIAEQVDAENAGGQRIVNKLNEKNGC